MSKIMKSIQASPNDTPRPTKLLVEQNTDYPGLQTSCKKSRFTNFTINPLYKFPTLLPSSSPTELEESDCYFPEQVKSSAFFELLYSNSPFKRGSHIDLKFSLLIEGANQCAPRNSLYTNSIDLISFTSTDKPFNLAEELLKDKPSLTDSNFSLNRSGSKEKSLKKPGIFLPARFDEFPLNSVSSINASHAKDSVMSQNEGILNFSNLEQSATEGENKRLYQKIDENTEVPSNDEALYTGMKTDESVKRNLHLVELVPETDEEISCFMYRSSEALQKAMAVKIIVEENSMSEPDDEGPLMVKPSRLFLNGETASKAKLSGEVEANRIIKKIWPKYLTEDSEFIYTTMPETQPSIDFPDSYSPLLKKLCIFSKNLNKLKILHSVCTSGFMAALLIEYSSEEALTKVYPLKSVNDLWLGLLSSSVVNMIQKTRVQWISCGFEHMVAVTCEHKVLSWGHGASGCLGHGNYTSQLNPTTIESLAGELIVYAECGGYHTAAVSTQGEVWVWGRGDVNQLGLEPQDLSTDEVGVVALLPIKLSTFSSSQISIKAVACGEAHTLLLDSEGKVYSFGWGDDGQLGTTDLSSCSSLISKKVMQVADLQAKVVKIAAGATFSACVNILGQVMIWGNGEQGQLGQGVSVKKSRVPLVVGLLGGEFIVDVVCGESHVLCVSQSGKVFVWGQGVAGAFEDQSLYPVGSDIVCFAPRHVAYAKNTQEYLVGAVGQENLAALVSDKLRHGADSNDN